jgi:hypothetical protein
MVCLAVRTDPGEGIGHRVTEDHEKNKGRVGSHQHHESKFVRGYSDVNWTTEDVEEDL